MCHGLNEPCRGSSLDSNLQRSRVNSVAPCLCHPSAFVSVSLGGPHPPVAGSMDQGPNQPSLGTGVNLCEETLMVSEMVSSLPDFKFNDLSLGFHHPPSIGGRHVCQPSVVSVSTPNLSHADEEVCRIGQQIAPLFRGVATRHPQGPFVDAMFLSGSQGTTSPGLAGSLPWRTIASGMGQSQCQVASLASQVLEVGVPLTHLSGTIGMAPSPSLASVPNRVAVTPFHLSLKSVGPSSSQISVVIPKNVDRWHPSEAPMVPPSYHQRDVIPQDSLRSPAGLGAAGSFVASRMSTGAVPGTLPGGMTSGLPPGSTVRGMGQSLPAGSVSSWVAPSLMADSKKPSLSVRPSASLAAPNLLLGSVMSGVNPGVSPGSVPMMGASSVAQSCSKVSVVIGITAPPYHKALAGERSIAPLQIPHTTSLAPGHSSAPAASDTVRSLHRVPTVLSRAYNGAKMLG
ncbi:PREDICTED: uncharacterized protein LOC108534219 [Rhinopithecus bieti]|uniref:uncharacterized protein LOC108534219 n=1 Tax=Rhinopithecus bieti TaxID=61621 RepID=UPI00083C3815|nr:PREDICTED: uncharacterized protein LOC108534219 [Rhinopithecus bieti]